jgi:hypothetical protein
MLVIFSYSLLGGAPKRGRGGGGPDSKTMDSVIEELSEELRLLGLQTTDAATTTMVTAATHVEAVRTVAADTLIKAMTREMLTKVSNSLETTNGDHKVQTCRNVLFADQLHHFKDVERNVQNIRLAMTSATKLVFTKTYANDKGEIQWSSVRSLIDDSRRRIDEQKGAETAYAAAARPAV